MVYSLYRIIVWGFSVMNLKNLVKSSVGLALIGCSAILSSSTMAEKVLHVGSWLPPKYIMNSVVLPTWGE